MTTTSRERRAQRHRQALESGDMVGNSDEWLLPWNGEPLTIVDVAAVVHDVCADLLREGRAEDESDISDLIMDSFLWVPPEWESVVLAMVAAEGARQEVLS